MQEVSAGMRDSLCCVGAGMHVHPCVLSLQSKQSRTSNHCLHNNLTVMSAAFRVSHKPITYMSKSLIIIMVYYYKQAISIKIWLDERDRDINV